jgi:hypothetical protein
MPFLAAQAAMKLTEIDRAPVWIRQFSPNEQHGTPYIDFHRANVAAVVMRPLEWLEICQKVKEPPAWFLFGACVASNWKF